MIVILALTAALALQANAQEPTPKPPEKSIPEQIFEELKPVTLENCDLKRFGSINDGGYLLCDNLSEGIKSAYSYGIGPDDSLGCEVSIRYKVPVHQYDCFNPARPTCPGGKFIFHDECIGPDSKRNEKPVFDTLPNQIALNKDTGKRLIVKMDIEGAEWDSLRVVPDELLALIDQLPMEMHGVDSQIHLDTIRRLKKHFHLVNLHFNNQACTDATKPLPAWAFQALWVNKKLGVVDKSAPVPAPYSKLNTPDNPNGPDCQLAPAGK